MNNDPDDVLELELPKIRKSWIPRITTANLATVADIQRLASRATVDSKGCWIWPMLEDNDYSYLCHKGKKSIASRFFYEIVHSMGAYRLVVDHLCKNPSCVNPRHLDAVTQKVNISRARKKGSLNKTHCVNGHKMTPENSYTRPPRQNRNPYNVCRTCRRLYG